MDEKSSSTPNSLGVPVAIVMAGGLIAAAVYFGGGSGTQTSVGDVDTGGQEAGQPFPEPEQPVVGDVREVGDEDRIRGAADARVTIIEYSDFECSFCKRFHPTMQQVVDEYDGDVRWVYRHFVLGMFPNSTEIAMASECAGEQGRFWEMSDAIFESPAAVTPAMLPDLAREAGVANMNQFQSCMDDEKYADKIQADTTDAQSAGGQGTPYSVVIAPNGEKFPINGALPYASVAQIIDQALASE